MTTDYQMWLTWNKEQEKLRVPVLPEKITVTVSGSSSSVKIADLGEVIIKQSRGAASVSFNSFFPASKFPGMAGEPQSPQGCIATLRRWQDSKKPVHLLVSGMGLDLFCVIARLTYYEAGGDVGTIYYELSLKEYREVTVRKVRNPSGDCAEVEQTQTRVDNSVPPSTYTVKPGDCLWNLAKQFYGDGSQYTRIQQANTALIAKHGGGPNMIWPGDVLTIPAA